MTTTHQHGADCFREHYEIADDLRALAQARFDLENELFELVLDARLNRMTWQQIGQALGVTAQAAQQRYGK